MSNGGSLGRFYVYIYTDPITNTPFYVGKGSGNRFEDHLVGSRSHNKHLKNKIAKLKTHGESPIVDIVFRTDDEDLAYEVEEVLITSYGRSVDGGSLCNFVLGGRGRHVAPFKQELYQYLGVKSDHEIAKMNGTTRKVVRRVRESLNIPPCGKDGRFKKGMEPINKDKRLWHLINEKTGETFVGHKVAFEKRYNVPSTNMAKLERGVYKSIARGFVLLMIEDVKDE